MLGALVLLVLGVGIGVAAHGFAPRTVACQRTAAASTTTPTVGGSPEQQALAVDAALPASWARDDLPSARDARSPLDALSAANPELEGSTSGFVMRWVTSPASTRAPQVELEQRSFAELAQAITAEISWCRLLTSASKVEHGGGPPAPAGSTGLLPLAGADGGFAFSLPPGGPLGFEHAGVTLVALHRSGRLLSIVESTAQPDLPAAIKRSIPRSAIAAALPPVLAALAREGGPGRPLGLSPKALLEQAQAMVGPGACGRAGGARSEPTSPFSARNRPDVDAPDAELAASCSLVAHDVDFDVTVVRFTSSSLAATYAARLSAASLAAPGTIDGQPSTLRVDEGLVEAVTRFDADVFSFDAFLPADDFSARTNPIVVPALGQIISVVRELEHAQTPSSATV